jgi:hypothetical protein
VSNYTAINFSTILYFFSDSFEIILLSMLESISRVL